MLRAIPATLMRGGSSKGLYFSKDVLPQDKATRDAVLLAAMGSPDIRQIDGLGGAHPLTSKVAIISASTRPDADIDYLFLQVFVDRAEVSDSQNCGNILAGVGPWAIENGLVEAQANMTPVRIHMLNTNSIAIAQVSTPDGIVEYEGSARIDGVPGTAAPIFIEFLDIAGSACGTLLPTGNSIDEIDGIRVTCIDNGMPVVLLNAADFGLTGDETPTELEADEVLKKRLEAIRLAAGPLMNLGDVTLKTVPKMTLVSPPRHGGTISTRSFIPHRVHEAIGVLGAISVATGCALKGGIAETIAHMPKNQSDMELSIEHPTGFFAVNMRVTGEAKNFQVERASLIRTARKLMQGNLYIRSGIWG